jgi:hypothetical protein
VPIKNHKNPALAAGVFDALPGTGMLNVMSHFAWLYPFADSAPFRNPQVIIILKIEPKLGWQSKILSQANGSVGTDGSMATDDFIDARKTQGFR